MRSQKLKLLFIVHALVTFAAGIVLALAPEIIPATVAVVVTKDQYLLCYLLSAAELAIAFLSFCSRKLTDRQAISVICYTMIVFHMATALFEVYILSCGGDRKLAANIVLRVVVSLLFYAFGIRRIKKELAETD